ncbi:MAG: RNHCP domain-containing protein [Defluviitaleaceae bacterium]|nr:RNHCP domain-containing protein [Defluviitaleaceae bacterium]
MIKTKKSQNSNFTCENCGRDVLRLVRESFRNHCPFCLYSKHVDDEPGDRASTCHGLMAPIGAKISAKGQQILHKCENCGFTRYNIFCDDDPNQSDDYELFLRLL